MTARSEPVEHTGVLSEDPDFGELFLLHYPRIARVIARMVQDPGRAEELAAEVFWKYWRNSKTPIESAGAWLYRSAVRSGLDELRRQHRRSRFENVFDFLRVAPSPEQLLAGEQEQKPVEQRGAGVTPPRIISSAQPNYTDEARRAHIQGAIILSVTFRTDGTAKVDKIVQGLGYGLDEKAIEAVEKFRFVPGMKEGQPVDVQLPVTMNFKLY